MTSKDRDRRHRAVRPEPPKPGEGTARRGRKAGFLFATALLLLLGAEGLAALALRWTEGQWPYARPRNVNYLLFEPHPEWVVAPRKGITVTVRGRRHHHNTDGFRGGEFARGKTKCRVACIGGSTTYGVGAGDEQTWPYHLDRLLQPEYEVLNFGIPGHSTVEHKKVLPLILAQYAPDIVVFQLGLNDLRNMNVANLGPDYRSFHQPSLYAASGFCRRDRLPRLAVLHAGVVLLEKVGVLAVYPFPKGFPAGQVADSVDPRVVAIFSANLEALLRDCRARQIGVVLLPHTVSPELIDDTNYKWWAPYLTKQGIFNALEALNAVMRGQARGDELVYAGFVNETPWQTAEFFDPSHLNAAGNARLARLLKEGVLWSRLRAQGEPSPK